MKWEQVGLVSAKTRNYYYYVAFNESMSHFPLITVKSFSYIPLFNISKRTRKQKKWLYRGI